MTKVPVIVLEKDVLRLVMLAARDASGWSRLVMNMVGGFDDLEPFMAFERQILPLCDRGLEKQPFIIVVPGDDMEIVPEVMEALMDCVRDFMADVNRREIRNRTEKIENMD